jgi:hypothetical protein
MLSQINPHTHIFSQLKRNAGRDSQLNGSQLSLDIERLL